MRPEKATELVTTLARKYACPDDEQRLRQCIEKNGLKSAKEMSRQNVCQTEGAALQRCSQAFGKDQNKVHEKLVEVGLDGCSRSLAALEQCVEQHGAIHQCKDQVTQLTDCAADYVLTKHENDPPLFPSES